MTAKFAPDFLVKTLMLGILARTRDFQRLSNERMDYIALDTLQI